MRGFLCRKKEGRVSFIAVFKSRNETLYLANCLSRMGVKVYVGNTPRDIGVTCGICVQFGENNLSHVKGIIASKPFRSFVGIFKVAREGTKSSFVKI